MTNFSGSESKSLRKNSQAKEIKATSSAIQVFSKPQTRILDSHGFDDYDDPVPE